MLLIPAENGFNKNNLPWVTFLLILLNVLAFIIFQGNDHDVYQEAVKSYKTQGLFELEKPEFIEYAKTKRPQLYYSILDNELPDDGLIQTIIFDKHFSQSLSQLSSFSPAWEEKRKQFNKILEDSSTHQYAFYPSEPSLLTAFSHMFMHGGIEHLIGNLIFLFLFGYNLEILIGKQKMLFTYFLSGLVAVGLFSFTTNDKFIPLVGASGAISGLMGGFAGFYGLKKIRYFYWIFVFFSYIRLPAIIVLVYWLLKELLQSGNNDGVAYMAHFGGLAAGASIVLLMKLIKNKTSITDSIELELSSDSLGFKHSTSNLQNDNQQQPLYDKARAAVKDLEFDTAKDYFYQLIALEPNNAKYLTHLYNLEKDKTNSAQFIELAESVLNKVLTQQSLERLANSIITELQNSPNKYNAISYQTLLRFCRHQLNTAQAQSVASMINFLTKEYSHESELPNLLLNFAMAHDPSNDWHARHKILSYLSKKYPDTFAGQEAMKEIANDQS